MSANVTLEAGTSETATSIDHGNVREIATLAPDLTSRPARTPWQIAIARFRRSKLALLGLLLITALSLIAVFADVFAPYGENEIDLFNITAQPSAEHLLGTDELGRDELSRLMFGARISLVVGVGTALLATALGIIVGSLAGYYGGWLDSTLMRFVDVILAFPAIFLLLIFFSIRGSSVMSVIVFL